MSTVLVKEVSAYGVVGAVNFAVDLAIYQVMYQHLGQGALVSKCASTAVTTTLAYFMHRHWSFSHRKGRDKLHNEYLIFFALSVVSLLLGLVIIGAVHYGFHVNGVYGLQVANIASIVLGVVFRFWAYRRWVFIE
jgi:putative flippase GtrA